MEKVNKYPLRALVLKYIFRNFLFFERKKFYNKILFFNCWNKMWIPISSTGKVSDGCIRDLRFNPRLHQKPIGVLVDRKSVV